MISFAYKPTVWQQRGKGGGVSATAGETQGRRSGWYVRWLVIVVAWFGAHASAQEAAITFDIAAQPLASALEQYSALTGKDLLYNSNLASGRMSKGVRGAMSADAALAVLLHDTGLAAFRHASGSILLSPTPVALETSVSPVVASYYGRIQAGLRAALCRESLARPGRYRIAMRLSIDGGGHLTRYEQFGSGGSAEVDEAIQRAVSQLGFGAAPPEGLRQPIVIVILPQAPGVTMGCDEATTVPARTVR